MPTILKNEKKKHGTFLHGTTIKIQCQETLICSLKEKKKKIIRCSPFERGLGALSKKNEARPRNGAGKEKWVSGPPSFALLEVF